MKRLTSWIFAMAMAAGLLSGMPQAYGQGATGGTITQDGSVWIHTFTTSDTFEINNPSGIRNVEILVVGGGGAGGGANNTAAAGGGGGGGDFVTNSYVSLSAQSITVTVGAYGTGVSGGVGNKGGNSTFAITSPSTNITARGGGGGGRRSGSGTTAPTTGGSSGGAAYASTSPAGTGINVKKGGNCGNYRGGAGGGGAATAGTDNNSGNNGTAGGQGMAWYGVVYSSGGGGGGACDGGVTYNGTGGNGGANAANGADGSDGVAKNGNNAPSNFGGGGGGSTGKSSGSASGGNGGSGVVIVRYELALSGEPAMRVRYDGTDIAVGATNALSDTLVDDAVFRTFTVTNLPAATANLLLTGTPDAVVFDNGLTNQNSFTITANIEGPDTELPPGAGATFTIGFVTNVLGSYTATVSIANSDSGKDPYRFQVVATAAGWARATGGATNGYTDAEGVWRAHIFTNVGTSFLQITDGGVIEYLIAAGGGGGAATSSGSTSDAGGGGGAGGLLAGTMYLSAGTSNIVVGAGGARKTTNGGVGNKGNDSTAFGRAAFGGGGGGWASQAATGGGSGGGAGSRTSLDAGQAGEGTEGQGHDGGARGGTWGKGAASGGGAGGRGIDSIDSHVGRNGGPGVTSGITGTATVYAAGGGGGGRDGNGGQSETAGHGGNLNQDGFDADANTGGGGGGGNGNGARQGGAGGSGIVVARYQLPSTVATDGAAFVLDVSAELRGVLSASGEFTVTAYWSTVNHPDSTAWESDTAKGSALVGTFTNAFNKPFAVSATDLAAETAYYFTFMATDGVTELWAWPNGTFQTTAEPTAVTVTLGNLDQTYDGTAKSVSVTTDPPDKSVGVTYGGSPSEPIDAGSYAVVAVVTDAGFVGSTNGTLVISKGTPVVTAAPTASSIGLGQSVGASTLSVRCCSTIAQMWIIHGMQRITRSTSV